MEPNSTQQIFEGLLHLVGRSVELATTTGKKLQGSIQNVMFDSFIIEVGGKPTVVRFIDLQYLAPK